MIIYDTIIYLNLYISNRNNNKIKSKLNGFNIIF